MEITTEFSPQDVVYIAVQDENGWNFYKDTIQSIVVDKDGYKYQMTLETVNEEQILPLYQEERMIQMVKSLNAI
jgi:predicted  nucleic acid-binding Zn-ribbon protein